MKIKKSIKSVSIAMIAMLIAFAMLLGIILRIDFRLVNVFADFNKKYYELTNSELDSLSFRTTRSEEAPKITILTHGLGGSDYHWSNSGGSVFTYRDHSLIEQLRNRILSEQNEAVVYTIRTASVEEPDLSLQTVSETKSDFVSDYNETVDSIVRGQPGAASHRMKYDELTFINEKKIFLTRHNIEKIGDSKYYNSNTSITEIEAEDVSKHIILIFDAYSSGLGNDYVYAQLEYVLDSISYQYYQFTSVLPTYNLIGHSRGGITNLQYALSHPYNVASLYSMGTPYNGSDFGEAEIVGYHPFLSLAQLKPTTDYKDIEDEYSPGVLDILDENISNSYMDYWNNNYDSFYNHIEFKPIGSYVTFGYVLQLIMEFIPNDTAEAILRGVMVAAETVIGAYTYLTPKWFKKIVLAGCIDVIEDLIKTYFDVDYKNAWLRIIDNFRVAPVLYEHIGFSYSPTFVIADDLFIDLDSQVALGYKGTKVKVRMMDSFDQISGQNKKNIDAPGVAHNLETQNLAIVDYIVNDIDFGQGEPAPFDYRYTDAGYYITNMRYNCSVNGILFIPETYSELPVIGIDSLTKDEILDENNEYHTYITEIHIPASIKEISNYAFAGMTKLSKIVFEEQNTVNSFNEGVFMNCSSLKTIENADNIVEVGVLSFYNCKSLLSYNVSDKVQSIGTNAFVGCSKLSSITVDAANPYYSSINGILFNKAGTELLYYPEGKTATSYVVPTSVTEIAPFAFYGNSKLTTLNLNNTGIIRQYALSGCENLATIQAPNLNYVEIGVFDGTKWLGTQAGDIVKLGNVLVLYQGTASELSIEGVTSIAPMAFANNETLGKITLNNGLTNIGDGAFYGCSNLETVYICNNSTMIFVSNASFEANAEGRVIYVPYHLQGEYQTNEFWEQYGDSIEVHQTNITYILNGGNCDVTSGSVYYQGYLDLPTPSKNGNTFKGWYNNAAFTGSELDEQTMWGSLAENVTFYAKWEENTYIALLQAEGGTLTETVISYKISDEAIILPIPTKEGYTFEGWYEKQDYSGEAVTEIPAGTYENKNYYAKWKSINYMVNLSLNYPDAPTFSEYIKYGEMDCIGAPNRMGYYFLGWAYNGELYTDNQGNLMEPWGITEEITLVAQWQAKESTIVLTIEDNAVEYTVLYDECIQLAVPTKVGHTFVGWYDENEKQYTDGNGMMIIPWDQEEVTVEFTAYWFVNTYTVIYNQNGGSGTLAASTHTYGVYKNLNTNTFYRTGYEFVGWASAANGSVVYADGASVINLSEMNGGTVTLYAVWRAKTYNIIYKNLMPNMIVSPNTCTYTYGEGLSELPIIYLSSSHEPRELQNFYGWYTSESFSTRVYSISTTKTGDITLYAKYDYFVSETYASYENTVTDGNINNQPSFLLGILLDSTNYEKIKDTTLSKIKIVISFEMWEVNDGYQDIYLYNGDTKIWEDTINRGSGVNSTRYTYTKTIELSIADYKDVDLLELKFGAHGNFADKWRFDNFTMALYFSN